MFNSVIWDQIAWAWALTIFWGLIFHVLYYPPLRFSRKFHFHRKNGTHDSFMSDVLERKVTLLEPFNLDILQLAAKALFISGIISGFIFMIVVIYDMNYRLSSVNVALFPATLMASGLAWGGLLYWISRENIKLFRRLSQAYVDNKLEYCIAEICASVKGKPWSK